MHVMLELLNGLCIYIFLYIINVYWLPGMCSLIYASANVNCIKLLVLFFHASNFLQFNVFNIMDGTSK